MLKTARNLDNPFELDMQTAAEAIATLAPRERVVAERIAFGLTTREIMAEFGLTLKTVEAYRKNVCVKLGVPGMFSIGRVWFAGMVYRENHR